MNSRNLVLAASIASSFGAALVPAVASATGFYIGADRLARSTDLDYADSTESYGTTHTRAKAGYEILDFLAVEAHFLTAGDDTDIDVVSDLYQFDTGTNVGIYAKPKTDFARANVYGLVGLAYWDTTYTNLSFPQEFTDKVVTFGAGVGGEFNITKNLRFNIEGMMQIGSASYGPYDPNIYSLSLAAGLSLHF